MPKKTYILSGGGGWGGTKPVSAKKMQAFAGKKLKMLGMFCNEYDFRVSVLSPAYTQ